MMKELQELRERAKELRCLYGIQEILSRRDQPPTGTFHDMLEAIPQGWQRPESTGARISYLGSNYVGRSYSSSGQSISEAIRLNGVEVGRIEVSDTAPTQDGISTFLDEETDLLRSIAHRLSEYLEWKHMELLGGRTSTTGIHWRWRERYAEAMAASLDPERFDVSAIYLGGSTEGGTAGPGSDIDLIVVCHGPEPLREKLNCWFEGWSLCLAELALSQTGYGFPGGILSIQWMQEKPDLRNRPDLRSLQLGDKPGFRR